MDYSIWKTYNGDILNIKDMSPEHMKNCINMIKRSKNGIPKIDIYEELPEPQRFYVDNYDLYKPYLEIFADELQSRGV